jgi:hypothetical protein
MRKLGACPFAVAAVALIGTAALAATHTRHGRRHHVIILRHMIHHAHFASAPSNCPPGSSNSNYCTPPAIDNVYQSYSTSGHASVTINAQNELLVGSCRPTAR